MVLRSDIEENRSFLKIKKDTALEIERSFVENFKEWIEDHNNDYPHSSLNYSTPSEYEKEHLLITNKF